MRAGIEARILAAWTKYTGIERSLLGLLEGLEDIADAPELLLYVRGTFSHAPPLPACARWRPIRIPALWLTLGLPIAARRDACDLIYFPYPVMPPYCPLPTVVMIYDLTMFKNPEHYSAQMLKVFAKPMRHAATHATHLIAISECTKRDLMELFALPDDRISAVPLGVGKKYHPIPQARDIVREAFGLQRPYVIFVGTVQPRKNLPRLIEAFARAAQAERLDHELVIVGHVGWLAEGSLRAAEKPDAKGRVRFLQYQEENLLPALYSAADALAFPSLYEGFGLPVLEAMACGTPVLTSNTSSLPEVAGEASLLVDPLNTDEIAQALRRILSDQALRQSLREKGMARARSFTWRKSAERTLSAFRRVGAGHRG